MDQPSAMANLSHWTKDFVEHLRAVHLALGAVSVSLLVVLIGAKDIDYSKALTQLTEIAELPVKWAKLRSNLYLAATRSADLPSTGGVLLRVTSATDYQAALQIDPQLHESWMTEDQFSEYSTWKFEGPDMTTAPTTIAEFRSWWDQWVGQGMRVHIPDLVRPGSCFATVLHASLALKKPSMQRLECEIAIRSMHPDPKQEGVPSWEFHSDNSVLLIFRVPFAPETARGWRVAPGDELFIQTDYQAKTVQITDDLLRRNLFSDWQHGVFDKSFHDLAALSQGLEHQSLSSVVDRVRDLQNKGDVPLEFFGLKIPGAEAGKWGLVILLATQFYFWMHLHELSRKIGPNDPGWEVAWIGVYYSKIAFIATLISSCVLPVAVGLLFARRLSSGQTSLFGSRGMFLASMVLMNGLIVVVATATTIRLFRLRSGRLPPP